MDIMEVSIDVLKPKKDRTLLLELTFTEFDNLIDIALNSENYQKPMLKDLLRTEIELEKITQEMKELREKRISKNEN